MRYFLSVALLAFATNASAMNVYWGGVSFSDWENWDSKFPNLATMMCSGDCPEDHLNSWALEALDQASFEFFQPSMDYINGRQIEGVIMTPMINAETASIYEDVTAGEVSFIHVYRIYASLVFFEFGSKRFISAKPVVLQYTDTRPEPAPPEVMKATFQRLVEPGQSQSNLFSELFSRGAPVQPFTFSQKYARIGEVGISEEALAALTSVSNDEAWIDQVKRQFEAFLIDATDAPLVPSMGTDQMTSEFVATFADASVKITMPQEVAFSVNVQIENFRKIEQPQRRQKTLCHAVALRLTVSGLISELFDERLVRGRQSCSVVTIDKQPDDAYYFTLSLLSLLKQASEQFSDTPDPKLIASIIDDSPTAEESFKTAWRIAFKPEL